MGTYTAVNPERVMCCTSLLEARFPDVVEAGDRHGCGFGRRTRPCSVRRGGNAGQSRDPRGDVRPRQHNPGQCVHQHSEDSADHSQTSDVTILALGPLTNIALAIRMDPEFSSNVKHILTMGGNMEGVGNITAGAEFNFRCDPEAAHITVHNMKCPVTIFPFETAYRYASIPYEWRKGVLGVVGTPQCELLNNVERVLLEGELYGRWGRCDPIAAAIVMVPEVATTVDDRYVTVELHGSATRGALVVDHLDKMGKRPNASIVSRVNVELYKEMLLQAFRLGFAPE